MPGNTSLGELAARDAAEPQLRKAFRRLSLEATASQTSRESNKL